MCQLMFYYNSTVKIRVLVGSYLFGFAEWLTNLRRGDCAD